MSIEIIIVTALLLAISIIACIVILYWHTSTRGTWRQWPAGRSLMGLFVIIAAAFGWGGVNRMLGDYALKQPILTALYACFAVALAVIGLTIRKELTNGRARLAENPPTDTGVIAVVMATTEEKPLMENPEPIDPAAPVDLPGPDHRADPKPNAFWRTLLQVGPPAALSLLVILPAVLQDVLNSFGESLPPGLYAALVGITATLTLISAILAKLMARPDVQRWLAQYAPFFAATKK